MTIENFRRRKTEIQSITFILRSPNDFFVCYKGSANEKVDFLNNYLSASVVCCT